MADVILEAIKEAERRLTALEAERQRLRRFVAHARTLTESARQAGEPRPAARPVWVGVRQALERAGRPLRLVELGAHVAALGWSLNRDRVEAVRAAIRRRPRVFERVGPGAYALRAWPPVKKRRIQKGLDTRRRRATVSAR